MILKILKIPILFLIAIFCLIMFSILWLFRSEKHTYYLWMFVAAMKRIKEKK